MLYHIRLRPPINIPLDINKYLHPSIGDFISRGRSFFVFKVFLINLIQIFPRRLLREYIRNEFKYNNEGGGPYLGVICRPLQRSFIIFEYT
jgi:hypothetical protein